MALCLPLLTKRRPSELARKCGSRQGRERQLPRFRLDTVQKRIWDASIESAALSFGVRADQRLLHFFGLLFV